jgi:hypothetical protein
VDVLKNEGYVRAVYDMKDLECCIKDAMENPISKKYERESNVICIIEEFIKEH